MKEEDKIIENYILKIVLLITTIASIIITIFTRLQIDEYTKFIILPITSIILSYTCFVNFTNLKINTKAYIYLGIIFLILYSYYIVPLAQVNKYLNIIIVPILTSIYVFSLINPNYKINLNFLRWFFKLIPGYLFSNTEYIESAVKETKINNNKGKDALKGLLIAVPILIIIILLLTSADKYFSSFLSSIFSTFKFSFNLNDIIEIGITLVLSFIFIFSTCINIYQMRKAKDFENKKISISNITTYIILGLVNLVYVLFLISEISKLTTNFLNVPVEYTYANYAREGFFQLLGVSTINFTILLFYNNFANYEDSKWIKYMLLTIIFFSIFIIINSYYRMGLYIFEYGYTVLRLQVILFLTMELIFFIILIFKFHNKLNKDKPLIYFIIMLVTYLLNIYLCNEYIINQINNLWFKYVLK